MKAAAVAIDSLKRRTLKRPSGIGAAVKPRGEGSTTNSFTVPADEIKEISGQSANICSRSDSSLGKSKDHSPNVLPKTYTDSGVNSSANSKDNPFSKLESEIQHVQQRRPASNYSMERNEEIHHLNTFQRHMAAGSKSRARSPAKSEYQFSHCRKTPISAFSRDQLHKDALELVDVEDEEALEEICQVPKPSLLCILQVTSKPVDFYLARDLKILLFGSSLGCFSEEWKIQSFAFNNNPQLKYGLVQKKGGPCGILAAVQACVLRHLIFGDSNRNSRAWGTELSEAHRTRCLALALARILWRAGGDKKAVIALCAGIQQFSPAGKYKADGILETTRKEYSLNLGGLLDPGSDSTPVYLWMRIDSLLHEHHPPIFSSQLKLHFLTTYEDLLMFLQQHIHEFEIGPYGCILLTLSVILSRSIDL
ncbi:putative ubiquitin carboxyl-terminal hydrolase MINDY-4 [Varanus komodoensis]|nr:putative ubiquitin carboxyl-terminal hydrolase MINDY-4 [Varanus komodoensis]